MANQLIPPVGMELSLPDHLTPDQLLALWVDLMDANEELLLAGLAREIGRMETFARPTGNGTQGKWKSSTEPRE